MNKCPHCGSQLKDARRMYCSRSCARQQPRAKRGPKYPPRLCPVCPESVPHGRKYCSIKCRRKAHTLTGMYVTSEQMFVMDSKFSSGKLKQRLYDDGLKEAKCEECGIVDWRGRPAPLQLDHENGNKWDNRYENLRILCANCHCQTDTYAGKNWGKYSVRSGGAASSQAS